MRIAVDSSMVLRAHWRRLANTIELVLPSAHPSPQPKRQIDRFSHSCTAHGRKSLYFQWALFPKKFPIPMGGSGPSSNTWFPGPTSVLNPKRHLDRFSRFAGLTSVTGHATRYNRLHLHCVPEKRPPCCFSMSKINRF